MENKYAVAAAADSVGRYVRKLAAISWHKAKCYVCKKRFVASEKEEASWQFAHIFPVGDPWNKTDRWSGKWRDEPLFTDEWIDFMGRVRLTCSQKCNHQAEGREMAPPLADIEQVEDLSICQMRQLGLFESPP